MAASPYRKVKRPKPPEPKPGIDYDKPIGPERPKSAGQVAREGVLSWVHRGVDNFLENANRPVREPREREHERGERHHGRRPSNRPAAPAWGMPSPGLDINFDAFEGGGIDLCQHPDPMARAFCLGEGPERERRPRSKTVTRTVTHYR